MESSSLPVVSTTSSIDLIKGEDESDSRESTSDGANSTMQNNKLKNGTNAVENEVQLIEGLNKPSEELEKVDFIRDSHNRVKLYVLCNQHAWDDRGTGHVACFPSPEDNKTWCIIVRLEANERNILESKIQSETVYQKQQGTLIVWSESDSVDLALSFQEKNGCTELWEKICSIQGRDPEVEVEEENETEEQDAPSDNSVSGISSAYGTAIPSCNLQNLSELEQALSNSMFANSQREKMATAIIQLSYIPKLCDMFCISEDLENREALHQMASIAKNLFLLNNNSILNELIEEKIFRNIVGMFEYDASFCEPKKHREFLWEKSRFKEVLPISSNKLKEKIHQTFRLQYVQDVCLPAPSIFEENLLTVLTSHLYFMRAEIVNALLNDKDLMQKLFEELKSLEILPERQRDLINFLKELCTFAHSLQPTGPQGREQFFKALMANDVLNTIDPCISSSLALTRTATVDMLIIIVDFNAQIFRDFLMKQFRLIPESKNDSLLINKLINHMLQDRDAEFTAATQMSNVLRILLDPESIVAKGEKGEFLQMFYKRAMQTLCAPIADNAKDGKPICDSYYMANKIALVIDLLCFFVEHHSYNMRTYIIQKGLIQQVLVYLKSKHHFLAHCALRLLRRIIGLSDDIYIRHVYDRGILDLVIDCFVANGIRYNLLNSSLIELFEYIRMQEIRPLMQYTVQKHWENTFSKIDYVRTFSTMKTRYEQFADSNGIFSGSKIGESASKENLLLPHSMTPPNSQWRKEREHDDEELFFSREDDDEMPAPQLRKPGLEPMFPSLSCRKRKANDDDDSIASVFGGNITPPAGSSSTNRISKIMIRMGSKESLPIHPQQQQSQLSSEMKTIATQKLVTTMPETIVLHSSNSATIYTTNANTSVTITPTSTLKRPLVDYDDSDDDETEEEKTVRDEDRIKYKISMDGQKYFSREEFDKSSGTRNGGEAIKMAKFSSNSSMRDPSSPPPDPEQQNSGIDLKLGNIST